MIHSSTTAPQSKVLLSVPAMADALSLSTNTIRAWLAKGKITHVKLGRAVRIPASEADRLISEGMEEAHN